MTKKSPAKFTDAFVKGLRPDPAKQKYLLRAELQGLALCVYRTGVKAWIFIYTLGGTRSSMTLGHYPDVSLAKARELYAEAWKVYASGKDPAKLAKAEEEERRTAPTITILVDDYIQSLTKRSKGQDDWALNKYVVPVLGGMKVADVRRRDIFDLLESIKVENGGGMCNQVRKYLSTMFNWAVEREIIEVSPVSAIKKLVKSTPRKRYLTSHEIIKFWKALDSDKLMISEEMKRALKLIIVTGQRPGDVVGMRLDEINGDVWIIPADRYKTDIDHVVHLTSLAKSLIAGGQHRSGLVFPTPHSTKWKPMLVNSMGHAIKRNLAAIGISPAFTPHDLRRTCATHLGRLGYSDEVIDAVLGHIKSGIIKTYNQHDYEEQKRKALIDWSDGLRHILGIKDKAVKFGSIPETPELDPLNPDPVVI